MNHITWMLAPYYQGNDCNPEKDALVIISNLQSEKTFLSGVLTPYCKFTVIRLKNNNI